MTIAFFARVVRELDLRGSTVATFDYADANETILGNRSVVLFDDRAANAPGALERFRRRFALAVCREPNDLDRTLEREKADLVYILKTGTPDEWVSNTIPTAVHAVFPTWPNDAHGSAYAYVSRWLARIFTSGVAPWVPHIVRLPDTSADLRNELAIPKDALVVGCHGGAESFDIPIARRAVEQALARRRDLWFAFLGIRPFVDHERALFLPATADPVAKTEFINTCDAMLHARYRGETFGLAVAEFSIRGRPVLTWGDSTERAHIEMLGDAALVYRSERGLLRRLLDLDRAWIAARDWDRYSHDYSAEPVMRRFADVFLEHRLDPARIRAARFRLEDWSPGGLRRYFRLCRRKLKGKAP
jgi:hypothetical protein